MGVVARSRWQWRELVGLESILAMEVVDLALGAVGESIVGFKDPLELGHRFRVPSRGVLVGVP